MQFATDLPAVARNERTRMVGATRLTVTATTLANIIIRSQQLVQENRFFVIVVGLLIAYIASIGKLSLQLSKPRALDGHHLAHVTPVLLFCPVAKIIDKITPRMCGSGGGFGWDRFLECSLGSPNIIFQRSGLPFERCSWHQGSSCLSLSWYANIQFSAMH